MSEPRTYGDLKRLLNASQRSNWPSRINPGMTHAQALDVLSAAVNQYPDEMVISNTPHGDLFKRNVLRECRVRADPRTARREGD